MSLVKQKIENLSEVVFELLSSGLHTKNDFSNTFVKRSIANSIYDQCRGLKSGFISVKAKEALEEGYLTRSQLCMEHPYPRTRTALDLFKCYDERIGVVPYQVIKEDMTKILENGCKTHYVLTEENRKLYPHQQDYSLTEEEIYFRAGVVLVPDVVKSNKYQLNGKSYYSMVDIKSDMGYSLHKIKKMIKNGEIQVG